MPNEYRDQFTQMRRRRVLKTIGGVGMAGLAGCGGGGGIGGGGGDGEVDVVFTIPGGDDPEPLELNPYNIDNNWGGWSGPTWIRPTVYHSDEDEWHNRMVDDWNYDGDTITVNCNDEYTWTDGSAVDAKDLAATTVLEMYTGATVGDYFDTFEAEDDLTAVGTLSDDFSGMSETILLQHLFHWANSALDTPWKKYKNFVQDFRAAETQEKVDEISAELLEFSLSPLDDDAMLSGHVELVDLEEGRLYWKIRDDFPNTENINFTDKENVLGMEAQEAAVAGTFDAAFTPGGEPQEWDDSLEVRGLVPVNMGHSLQFNWVDHDRFDHREVRKAIAHMMDNDKYVKVVETHAGHAPVEHQTGMPPEYAADWLDGDTDYLTDYQGHDYDRAAELLESVGFYQDGETWYRPDDEEFAPEIFVPEWFPSVVEFAVNEMRSFGIEAEARVAEFSTFDEQVNQKRNYEMSWIFVGATFLPNPYFDYARTYTGILEGGAGPEIRGMEPEWDVPMPVGDPDGDLETIDVTEIIDELLFANNREEQIEKVRTLAWIYNQTLPYYQFDSYSDQWVWNVDDWDLPDEDHWVWSTPHPLYLVFEEGLIQADPGTDTQV